MTKKVPTKTFEKQHEIVKNSNDKYFLKKGTKFMVSDMYAKNNLFTTIEKKDRVINGALFFTVEVDGKPYSKGTKLAQFQGDYLVCTTPAENLIKMKGE